MKPIERRVDPLTNRVVVTRADQLTGVLSSTSQYFIDGIVDMGDTTIIVPAAGLTITGYDFEKSKLVSNAPGYTMFTSPVGGSGNVIGADYAIEVTGVGSQVYDLVSDTGFEAFEFTRINYNDCTSLGTINNYRQGLEVGTGRFGGTPTLTLAGAWVGGFRITTSITRGLSPTMNAPLFSAGTGFTMQSRFLTDMNSDFGATAYFTDFTPANFVNPSTFIIDGAIFTRNGVTDPSDMTIVPNITASALESKWKENQGLDNTFEGGLVTITSESPTVITTINTPVTLAGTWTPINLQHFDSPSSGQLRNLGTTPHEFIVHTDIVLLGTAGDDIRLTLRKWDNSASAFVDVFSQIRRITSLAGARDVALFTLLISFTLDQNDYVFAQVTNTTSTDDVTAEIDSSIIIYER